MNSGHLPADNLPYYKQLIAYKDFVAEIEGRALSTLKSAVQRLIMDFENYQAGIAGNNEVSNFNQKERETKHQALRRLIAVMNESEATLKEVAPSPTKGNQAQLTQSGRATKDIKRFINQLLE